MKTDSQLLAIFQNNPDMLKELLGLDGEAPYRLKSEEFKNLARTADGVFDYDGAQIAYIIEFQGQKEPYIYHRAAMERIMYSQLHPEKRVYMVIVFLQEGFDPETEPWCGLSKAGNPYFRVLYLEDVLGDLAERDPDHPLYWRRSAFRRVTTTRPVLSRSGTSEAGIALPASVPIAIATTRA